MSSRPDVVRSVNQRWLLDHWNSLRDTRLLPLWAEINTERLSFVADDLLFCDVISGGGGPRFLVQFRGERVAQTYGRDCIGRFLDELMPANQQSALAVYRETVNAQMPVYTLADFRDSTGRIVHHERLLLPFGGGSDGVDRILASLETVSPEGAFDNRDLMKTLTRPPALALCTTIAH